MRLRSCVGMGAEGCGVCDDRFGGRADITRVLTADMILSMFSSSHQLKDFVRVWHSSFQQKRIQHHKVQHHCHFQS